MSDIKALIRDLVAANRILAHEGVCDAYGHVSVRHPDDPERFFLSRSRSPELVEAEDIIEYHLDCTPVTDDGRPNYIERPIHGAVYAARPDVMSVVHNHSYDVLPFAITKTPMRPAIHMARRLGGPLPVWDIADAFGDTDLLVTTLDQGRDMAATMGEAKGVIMRGHGCTLTGVTIPEAVEAAIVTQINARAITTGLQLGEITYLSDGEATAPRTGEASLRGHNRAWEYLCRRAGVSL